MPRSYGLPVTLGVLLFFATAGGLIYSRFASQEPTPIPSPNAEPSVAASPSAIPSGTATPTATPAKADLTADAQGLSKATVVMQTSAGTIKFKFYPNEAPNTVARIAELISKGFYDNLVFHRVLPGFVVQGGDPTGTGRGGSGQPLKAEFNRRKHVEGAVAMARGGDPDSADSQFYITLSTFPHLDGNYTVFGQVIEGMDVVRKIKQGDKMLSVRVE